MSGTSRQRIIRALDHVQPDRVPIDFGSHRSSGIMAIAYRNLRRHLGLPDRPLRLYDVIQQLAVIDEDALERFSVDTIELGRGFGNDESDWKPWTLPDGSDCLIPAKANIVKEGDEWRLLSPGGRCIGVQRAGMLYFDQVFWPFVDGLPEDLSNLPDILPDVMWSVCPPPAPPTVEPADFAEGAKTLRQSTDRAVVSLFGGNLLETSQFLCRNDNFFMMLASEPKEAHRLLDRLVEMYLPRMEEFLGAAGPYVDIILFGDDLGMQTGPQISPAMYREFFKPRHSVLWHRAKELADVKVMLHCCGGVRPLLDDLIDAGLDAINPVQTSCEGMDPAGLKADFGDRLCFWGGGCDTQSVLPHVSPEEIRSHVLERLEIFSPGGGFVFQQVHNIMADIPPENIVAMFDAVAEFNA